MNLKCFWPILAAFAASLLALVGYAAFARWPGLNFSIAPQDLMTKLSPLLLAAGFIERAVEVLVSPWRDAEADKRQAALDSAKRTADPGQIKVASDALHDYRGDTQQYAFGVALLLGFAAAIVGVRALWPLLTTPNLTGVSGSQQTAFHVVDVFLSAVMVAGGAAGIHSVVTAFTSFFDATGEKARKSATS